MRNDDEYEYRRKTDVVIAHLQTTLENFVARYERDLKDQNISLREILLTIKTHDEFIKDIKPVYARGMVALGAAALATIGMAVNWLWHHIHFGN